MALVKQPVEINFARGLDTKTDPYQVQVGNFLRLQNSVFDKLGRLTKRNGFGTFTSLTQPASFITTFNGNLTAVGDVLQAYAPGSNTWVNRGTIQPLSLSTLSLIRSNSNQVQADTAISDNNFICTVFTDVSSGSTTRKYAIADATTGQNILSPAAIPSPATIVDAPRVFYLAPYFVIVYTTASTIRYVTISAMNPVAPTGSTLISSQASPSSGVNWDGVVTQKNLYIVWNGSDLGGAIRIAYLDSQLNLHSAPATPGFAATLMAVCADTSGLTPVIYASFYNSGTTDTYTMAFNDTAQVVLAPTTILTGVTVDNLTCVASGNIETVYYEVDNNYSYDSSIPTHYINSITCTLGGSVGTPHLVDRSVGLASKAFTVNGNTYFLAAYQSDFQPTYFLLKSDGSVASILAIRVKYPPVQVLYLSMRYALPVVCIDSAACVAVWDDLANLSELEAEA